MVFEEALEFVEFTLKTKTGKKLSDPEKQILKAAWDNKTYNDIADSLYLSVGYIKDLAALLWQRISETIGTKVTKSNFRYLLEKQSFNAPNIYQNLRVNQNEQLESNKGNILIVDDQPDNLRFLTEILTAEGYKVRSVTNGKMAIKTVTHNPPDLILMDIKMPDMDGYQVCEALKLSPDSSEIPIIFLSALDEVMDKIKAFQMGGVDYITKPFHPQEVIARIETQLTIQKQKVQLRQEIEKHQQTVEIVYQSRSLLASLLNSSLDGLAVLQAMREQLTGEINDFLCVLVNPVFAKLLKKKREEFTNKVIFKELLHQINPNFFNLLVQVVETQEPLEHKFCYENNDTCEYYLLMIVKFGDGVSITAYNLEKYKQVVLKWSEINIGFY